MNINEQRVQEFAHQIWQSEGCPEGQSDRHWEMACRLAEESDENHQQQAAPQHQTVEHNDSDIINKPKKGKAKGLKKTLEKTDGKAKEKAKRSFDSVNQNLAAPQGKTAMEGLPEPTSGPEKVSFAKSGSPKTARGKKAKLLKEVVDTELSPVNSETQPV